MLKIYRAHDGCPEETAILVFAHNIKEGKKIAYPVLQGFCGDTQWTHLRVELLKDSEYLRSEGDPELLKKDIAHYNDFPTICKQCEYWGHEICEDGICKECKGTENPNE
jgi:hypothetical protein